MSCETSQASSMDWLGRNDYIRISSSNYFEIQTTSISERQLDQDLALELKRWDHLSDEALRRFEEIL